MYNIINFLINEFNQLILVLNSNIYLSIMVIIFFGLILGSLHNVITSRLLIMENINGINYAIDLNLKLDNNIKKYYKKYNKYSLFFPSSNCPKCNNNIKWWHNIPLLGYLLLRGECYFCKEKISIEYPAIEFLVAMGFVINYFIFGWNLSFILFSFLFYFLLIHFVTDIKEKILFDSITLLILVVGFIYLFQYNDFSLFKERFYSSFLVFSLTYIFIKSYERIRNIDYAFGRGDIKLMAALSLFLSLNNIINLFILSSIIGVIAFIFLFFKNKSIKENNEIPFAPCIIIAFYTLLII